MSPHPARARTSGERAAGKTQAEVLEQWEGDPSFMQSLARGLLVLNAVAKAQNGSSSIPELVALTGLPRATVRRCIYTLESIGYVRSVPDGAAPGPELVGMTTSFFSSSPILAAYKPIIAKLRDDTGQSVAFGLYEGWQALFVSDAPSRSSVRIWTLPTAEFPLYSMSIGRILLASKSEAELADYLRKVDLVAHTERSIVTAKGIRDEVKQARASGYSIVDEEVEIGLRSVTVPVYNGSGSLAAWININTHVNITGARELKSKILPKMLSAAEELSNLAP